MKTLRDRLEKRLSPRRSAAIPAVITFDRDRANCIIRNISDTGAKLEVATVAQIPNAIQLCVPGHMPQNCRVVWRALREVGVSFETPV